MKPEQLEIDRLRREVTKFKPERDILKKAAAFFAREAGTVRNFVPEAIRWNRKDHRYGNREGRSGPAAVGA